VEAMTLADTLWVLNGGLVEQKGSPLDVYERPRTKFVATFLGSPQMNLLEGSLVREGGRFFAEGGGMRARLDEDRFGKTLEEGRAVTIGVRPHDLVTASEGRVAELKVEIVEALGSEAFAHGWLTQAGPSIVARLTPEEARATRAGTTLAVTVSPSRVHLFDPKTGVSLACG
ncbi:MAG TPA: TOBE domain-containing protein, partial [Labilithrix sp.]